MKILKKEVTNDIVTLKLSSNNIEHFVSATKKQFVTLGLIRIKRMIEGKKH